MILFLSLLFVSIYTQFIGAKNGFCHINQPCSYQVALMKIRPGTKIFIRDKYISSKQQIDGFKAFVEKAAKLNCSIIGRGTIINTLTFQSKKPLFDIKNTSNFIFTNFTFLNIKAPLFKFSNSNKIVISNISISSSSLTNSSSLIITHKSKVLIENFALEQTSFYHSFLLKMDKSIVLLSNSSFFQNFIFHDTENPFIALKETKFIIKDSNFLRSSSYSSPFITALSKSFISIVGSNFTEENHRDLIKANFDDTQIEIHNSSFNVCYGSILYLNNSNAKASIIGSQFKHNFAPESQLFNVLNGASLTINSSYFFDNSGNHLCLSNNSLSNVKIINSTIENNKNTLSIFSTINQSSLHIKNSYFEENFAGEAIFTSNEGKLSITDNRINQNPSFVLSTNLSTLKMNGNEVNIGNYSIKQDLCSCSETKIIFNDEEVNKIDNEKLLNSHHH